jgi:alginate O-acetyltransferase complex protein AlgJ
MSVSAAVSGTSPPEGAARHYPGRVAAPESDPRTGDTQPGRPPAKPTPPSLPSLHESFLPKEHALHRPRHGRRQRTALVCALVFFLTPALAFTFGVRPKAIENHALAAFPGFGWSMFTDLSDWATDHLPLRDAGVRAEDGISQGVFGEPPAYSKTERQGSGTQVGPIVQSPGPTGDPTNDYSQVIEGAKGWLYYAADMTAKCQPNQPLAATIAGLRQLRSAVESSGRSLVLVVAPDKSTVVPQYLPADYPQKQCAQAAEGPFWTDVTTSAGALDMRSSLKDLAGVEHRPVYYPQDTHWTDLGAIDMLRTVADQIDPGVTASWRTQPAGFFSFGADLPPMVGRSGSDLDLRYALSPDGGQDRTGVENRNLDVPVHFGSSSTLGMIDEPVMLLGDSFLGLSTRYLPAVFSDSTAVAYSALTSDLTQVEADMVNSHVVVVEIVERYLAAGTAQFLEPQVISALRSTLAAHPLR